MGEIKILVSEKTEKLINKICDEIKNKKTEYIKFLLIENLKEIKSSEKRSGK